MSIAFIADIHTGNFQRFGGPMRAGINDRGRTVLTSLSHAVMKAQDCEALVILGDLFHYSNPEPALTAMVQEILQEHPEVILIPGNHDMVSTEFGNHALAPLAPVAHVVEGPTLSSYDTCELWLVPFKPGPVLEWLPDALEMLHERSTRVDTRARVLCLHLGISDEDTPYYLDSSAGSIGYKMLAELCNAYGIATVFSGDWHRHQTWKHMDVSIVQVGALCPNRFPPGYEHGDRGPMLHFLDDGIMTLSDIPGPRFYKRQWTEAEVDWPPIAWDYDNCTRYLKLRAKSADAAEARAWLESRTDLAGFELDIDRGVEKAKAKTASFEARQASSLDEACARYVQRMALDSDCSRDKVLANVRRFIG